MAGDEKKFTYREVATMQRINDLELSLGGDISTIKNDVAIINTKLDQILDDQKCYKAKVDKLEHTMIKIETWGLAVAAMFGGAAGWLKESLNL